MAPNASMALPDGAPIIEMVIFKRVAASSAGVTLSVTVASAAPTSVRVRPKTSAVGRMPVAMALLSCSIFMSPVPTIAFKVPIAELAVIPSLENAAIVPITACVVSSRLAPPTFARLADWRTMSIA